MAESKGIVFDIQRFSLHDGPGIRTLVFLKGCPLRCRWCDNPESINPYPVLGFTKALCNNCGSCLSACPEQSITLDKDGMPEIDPVRCTNCGDCAVVCLPQALVMYGKEMTAAEVLQEVRQDEMFYGDSGGVTVSGGEPLQQAPFVKTLFEMCRGAGIRTAIETCGFASQQTLTQVLSLTDYVLFDLKHLDSRVHKEFTDQPNAAILENARLVAGSGLPVLFRCPLVQGVNDSPENIKATASFLKSIQSRPALELMPYHRLGKAKYEALRQPYPLEELQPSEPEHVESVRQAYEGLGVECTVSK